MEYIQQSLKQNAPKYSNRLAFANSADLDQTSQSVASDQGLHCLPLIYQILDTLKSN